jgi:F-box/WD-40 domain protein 7
MEEFTCSICLQPFTDPVRVCTGHVYDRQCIVTWFRSRPPPHICPLSNVRLPSLQLLPAVDVTQRALAWAAEHSPESAAAFTQPPPVLLEMPVQRPKPEPCLTPQQTTGVAAAWAAWHILVAVLNIGLKRSALTTMDDNFPLHNRGSRYGTQPWRMATCLFTSRNLTMGVLDYVGQLVLLSLLLAPLRATEARTELAHMSFAGIFGSLTAGVAFPDETFAGGFTLTSVFAACLLARSWLKNVGAGAAASFCLVVSVACATGQSTELLSPLSALFFYALLSHKGNHTKKAGAAALFACLGLVVAWAFGASAPWLRRGLAPQVDFVGIYKKALA